MPGIGDQDGPEYAATEGSESRLPSLAQTIKVIVCVNHPSEGGKNSTTEEAAQNNVDELPFRTKCPMDI